MLTKVQRVWDKEKYRGRADVPRKTKGKHQRHEERGNIEHSQTCSSKWASRSKKIAQILWLPKVSSQNRSGGDQQIQPCKSRRPVNGLREHDLI